MANILVTGSNSGFGNLTVRSLAKKGHSVVASMREPNGKNRAAADELRRFAETDKVSVKIVELDVTNDASVEAGVAAAGPLDVVINNAGYSIVGLIETATPDQILANFNTNVVGFQRVSRAVLPQMRAKHAGLLIHVSSGLGRIIIPLLGVYTATKWAVEAMFESLRYELKPTGVESVIVQPGAFPTTFNTNGQLGADQERAGGYGPFAQGLAMMGKTMETMFSVPNPPNPQEVADAIVALVDMPAGKRPARTVVDRFNGDAPRGLNDAHAQVQKGLLTGMGMPFLAD